MRQYLIDLLKGLEAAIPPPACSHHAMTYARYGSDEMDWEDKLAIQVNRDGVFHCVFLDEEDLVGRPEEVVASIVDLLSVPFPNAQLGIGLGQYTDEKS